MLPLSPYAWVLMERRKLLCTPRSPGNPAVQLIPSAPIANLKRWTKSHRRRPREKTKKAGIEWRGTVDHAGVPRQSTIRVTLDTYTQAIATEKRNAQDPWSRCCSEERRKKQARPGRDSTVCTYFCVLVCLRQKRNVSYTLLDFESRGDGLEPSASAVTGNRGRVSQQLARSRGLPNTA